MKWKVLDTGPATAERNMQLDAELLETLGSEAILHFYAWEKESITYGYFIEPGKLLNLQKLKELDIDLARRPTGGGVVFHLWDLAFSVLLPASSPYFSQNTLENYAFVNRAVLEAVQTFLGRTKLTLTPQDAPAQSTASANFCMGRPTKYDVMLDGRKIAGAAQRKRKQGFLHQGTIALAMPPKELLRALLLPEGQVAEAILAHTYPLLEGQVSAAQLQAARRELMHGLEKSLSQIS